MIDITQLYLKKKIPEISQLDLSVASQEVYVLLSSDESAFNHLSNIFRGLETDFRGTVKIDDVNIQEHKDAYRSNIAFLETGNQWPQDMTAGQVISFLKRCLSIPEDDFEELYIKLDLVHLHHRRIMELEVDVWRKILFNLYRFKKSKNYIIRNFARGMPLDFNLEFRKHLNLLKAEGASILYLSDDVFFAPEIGDRIGFMKKGKLLLEIKATTLKKMSLKELYFQFL